MRPSVAGVLAALLLVGLAPIAAHAEDTPPPQPAPEAVDVDSASVPAVSDAVAAQAERDDADAADLVAELPARRTGDYSLVGVTWTRGFDDTAMTVQVRLRSHGTWSRWQDLDVETDEGDGGRDGTEPLWTGSSDGVAVRVTSPTGQRPPSLSVATIDPGTGPATSDSGSTTRPAFYDSRQASAATQASDGSPSYTPMPAIRTRSSWGAAPHTYCDSPQTGNETRGVIVHHTAGSNSYSPSESAGIVRAVQAYHMKSRDWCDIGYNFLVDKYGQIFEGRFGGLDKPVRGAHAGDKTVNTYTMGVSMMGTFETSAPSSELKTAMVKLIGWRLGTTFHPATGSYPVGDYSLERIAGHRNVINTACPGRLGYAWLSESGGLRDRVQAYIAGYSTPMKALYEGLGAARTGPVFIGERGSTARRADLRNLDLYYKSGLGAFYSSGAIRSEYDRVDAEAGHLGYPIAEAGPSVGTPGTQQSFERGRIYRVIGPRTTAYAIWGAVAAKYEELGETGGALGSPTKRETRLSSGSYRAYFEHGMITRRAGGTVLVTIT